MATLLELARLSHETDLTLCVERVGEVVKGQASQDDLAAILALLQRKSKQELASIRERQSPCWKLEVIANAGSERSVEATGAELVLAWEG